jgi:hypothetical protein
VSAVGIYVGPYDPKANNGKGGFPSARRLGDDGRITSEHIEAVPSEVEIVANALRQLDVWVARRTLDGKDSSVWLEGAITNTQKFGGQTADDAPSDP